MTVFSTRYAVKRLKVNYERLYDSYRRLLQVVQQKNSMADFICSLEQKIYKLQSQVMYVEQNQLFKETFKSKRSEEPQRLRSRDLTDTVMHLPGRQYQGGSVKIETPIEKEYTARKSQPMIGIEESQVMHLDEIERKKNNQSKQVEVEPTTQNYTYTFKKDKQS